VHLCADLDPVVSPPGLTVLGLNSMPRWRWKSGGVTRRQIATVVESLGAATAGSVRVLALHHPPFVGGLDRLVRRRRLEAAIVAARVDLVLAGHTHVPLAREVELVAGDRKHRLVEVVAGTATSRRTRGVGRSWTLISVDDRTVTAQVRSQDGCGWRTGATVVLKRPSGSTGRSTGRPVATACGRAAATTIVRASLSWRACPRRSTSDHRAPIGR